ncbi:hypothetical protein UFOVP625_9 [uncultured Caudovirales phage]|uniref:Queuine tRNA-ribosyltransferase n=1 Tax=uncultured Caudovirales phage TaxID=2100421 RepID=A0A6J5N838_9CAUD|nr:hypothetical protein UFOVP625_9 [uncultured Caudovirales phage]
MLMTRTADGLHLHLAAATVSAPHLAKSFSSVANDEQPLKILISYHYFKTADLDKMVANMQTKPLIFGDCGAFSAHTQGVDINIKDYAAWLKRWQHLINVYVNLDVIRNPEATEKNQRILERTGLQPIPVFHTGTDFKYLDKLCKEYPYIALGGMVGAEATTTMRWAATCMKRSEEHGTAFHGFGQTRAKVIESLPWYSVDSSSWGMGHRYGLVPVWTGRQFEKVKIGDKQSVYKHAATIRKFGVDPICLADRGRYNQRYAIQVAAASWREWEKLLRKRHGAIKCPDRPSGLHIHLVDTAKENLVHSAGSMKKQTQEKE